MTEGIELTAAERSQRRLLLRTRRTDLTSTERGAAAQAVVQRLIAICAERDARSVGVYAAIDGELDCEPAAQELRRLDIETWYPVLDDSGLRFRRWDGRAARVPGRHGITEPRSGRTVRALELDVVIVPLVAFDTAGNRLGFGAGHYDRALGDRALGEPRRPDDLSPVTVGLAYDMQELPRWAPAAHDVAIDLVVTPTRSIRCASD